MPYFLVYVSTADHLMTHAELRDLLQFCQPRNAELGVRGALLYRDGTFMQALEGDRLTVGNLYAKIRRDSRHRDLTLIIDSETSVQQFPDWMMSFRGYTASVDDMANGYSDFINSKHDTTYGRHPTIAQRILLTFRTSHAFTG